MLVSQEPCRINLICFASHSEAQHPNRLDVDKQTPAVLGWFRNALNMQSRMHTADTETSNRQRMSFMTVFWTPPHLGGDIKCDTDIIWEVILIIIIIILFLLILYYILLYYYYIIIILLYMLFLHLVFYHIINKI